MRVLGSAVLLVTAVLLPTGASAQATTGAGVPANICKELASFLHPPAAPAPAAAPSAQSAVQAPNPGGGAATPPAGGEPQKSAGLSGPVPNGGPGAAGPQGATQNAAAPSGAAPQTQAATPAAPAAAPPPPPKKPAPEEVEKADAAIGANDIAACQASARGMRRAGVVMPAPLMSLAALDLKFLEAAR